MQAVLDRHCVYLRPERSDHALEPFRRLVIVVIVVRFCFLIRDCPDVHRLGHSEHAANEPRISDVEPQRSKRNIPFRRAGAHDELAQVDPLSTRKLERHRIPNRIGVVGFRPAGERMDDLAFVDVSFCEPRPDPQRLTSGIVWDRYRIVDVDVAVTKTVEHRHDGPLPDDFSKRRSAPRPHDS